MSKENRIIMCIMAVLLFLLGVYGAIRYNDVPWLYFYFGTLSTNGVWVFLLILEKRKGGKS